MRSLVRIRFLREESVYQLPIVVRYLFDTIPLC